ncbi:MAG: hypothetical protein Q7K71_00235 [Candidatus Omnitrophota bacterium]|nr:hypothetical protein [Candidatus Omnitrophota bacterium]
MLSRLDKKSLALVRQIGVLADESGMRAYLVGGPVRDLALKAPSIDLDITVEGQGMRLAGLFAAKHAGSKIVRYPAFKTATVFLPNGRAVDFATARKETYARPGALPSVTASVLRDDLFRRDFTINAMAVVLNAAAWGKIRDPFNGRADLRSKKIRVLHDKSFMDDPTRVLRAARFAGRLRFTVVPGTLKLLKEAVRAGAVDALKVQRYSKELDKILKEDDPAPALEYLKAWGAQRRPHVTD